MSSDFERSHPASTPAADEAVKTLGFTLFETAIGCCALAWSDAGLTGVQLPEADEAATRRRMRLRFPGAPEMQPPTASREAVERITALLAGQSDDLRSIVLDMRTVGDFQRRVYDCVRAIAPGHTQTYGEVARQIGQPGAARAVGKAMGDNPFAPVVPCHRVLAARSGSGGFSAAGGIRTKLRMLTIEGARIGDAEGLFDI